MKSRMRSKSKVEVSKNPKISMENYFKTVFETLFQVEKSKLEIKRLEDHEEHPLAKVKF